MWFVRKHSLPEFQVSEKERTAKLGQIKGSETGQQQLTKWEC